MANVKKHVKKDRIIKFYGKMHSLHHRYIAKSRMFNVSFKDIRILNVNFKGAIITNSSFKNAVITNCEFLGTNLSKCNFQGAKIKNCVFMGTKLKGTNFKNATFENVIFAMQNLKECKNLLLFSNTNRIVKQITKIKLLDELQKQIDIYHDLSKDKITHLLKLGEKKYNYLHISILLEHFTQEQLAFAIKNMISKRIFNIQTIFDFEKNCKKELDMLH